MEGFTCSLKNIRPIAEWVDTPAEGEDCPPCLIAPIASYYLGILTAAGENDIAKKLESVFEAGDILTICQELDNIKTEVGEKTLKELKDIDCFAQSFKQD